MLRIDRYLRTLKSYVRNKSRPKGSIVEGYMAKECVTFCSRYLHDVETKHDCEEMNYIPANNITNEGLSIFKCMRRTIGKSTSRVLKTEEWSQAHLYVLSKCEEVTSFIELDDCLNKNFFHFSCRNVILVFISIIITNIYFQRAQTIYKG